MSNKLKVVELFAGVGGFRIGLEGWQNKSASSNFKEEFNSNYKIIWSNQYEPKTKKQHASIVYENKFGNDGHCKIDIEKVDINTIPEHDILVGGFPCQDYSVASTLKNSKGIEGKKGVLWWTIHNILLKQTVKTKYLILENVDRLLSSPSKQKGRDFAIILSTLNNLDYIVEWRVINAADYGMPQRRKRTFILAYHKTSDIYNEIINPENWIKTNGTLANAFPIENSNLDKLKEICLNTDVAKLSEDFNKNGDINKFENSGIMIDGIVYTTKVNPLYHGNKTTIKDIILPENQVPSSFFINEKDIPKWEYLKGSKKEVRVAANGFEYNYTEGKMIFPDSLDNASRTIITDEGGNSPSRFKHVIETSLGLRRLTPIELERLNMFPDNHTNVKDCSDTKRAFLMGNALVIGVIEKIGIALNNKIITHLSKKKND